MPYLWQAFGLAEAVEESGDLYGALGDPSAPRSSAPVQGRRARGGGPAAQAFARAAVALGDLRQVPSALVALGQGRRLAAGDPRRAAESLYRAAELARAAGLLPWRIQDAEQALAAAEAAVRAAG